MKLLISLVLAFVFAWAATALNFTALGLFGVALIAVAASFASPFVLREEVQKFGWVAFAFAFGAIMGELGLHQAWAGYVLAVALGVLAAAIAARLPLGTAKKTA